MHFTALAIKTANETPSSLCALEIVIVKQGRIIKQKNWFFRPTEMRFEPSQKRQYQIHPIDVIDAPDFSCMWPEIKPYLDNEIIICHHSAHLWFILCQVLDRLILPYPNCYFICTMMLGRCIYPNFHSRKLSDLCTYSGIAYNPQEPSDSATACAQLFLRMAKVCHADDCEEVLRNLHSSWGIITPHQITWPSFEPDKLQTSGKDEESFSIHSVPQYKKASNASASVPHFQLRGQVVCLTGSLESMTRVRAVKYLNQLGASYSSSVTAKTTVVITNVANPELLPREHLTSKLRKALMLIDQGHPITIMNESTFLSFIS